MILKPFFCLSLTQGVSQESTLYLRIPFWTNSNGAKATLNDQDLPLPLPGELLIILTFILIIIVVVVLLVVKSF